MKQLWKIVGIGVFLLLLVTVSLKLFYPWIFENRVDVSDIDYEREISIGLNSAYDELEPTYFDTATRQRLLQIYEPLVMADKNLNMKPVLALSFGQIEPKTWKFRIREGVKFHDGLRLTTDDVAASIQRAKSHEKSQLKNLLQNISKVEKLSETELLISLLEPDPLFLNKISTVLIAPNGNVGKEPIGTGPYMYLEENNKDLILRRNDLYWDEKPAFKTVSLLALDTLTEWSSNIDKVDIGFSVPFSLHKRAKHHLIHVPSLEVTYLAFNFSFGIFKDLDMREALKYAIDREELSDFLGEVVRPASQFVSSGVMGFDPEIELPEKDIEKAKHYVRAVHSFTRPKVTLDALDGQEAVTDYIQNKLSDIGIDVSVNLMSFEKLSEKVMSGKSEMYLFGFKSELGDSYDFYTSAVMNGSKYNGGLYESGISDSQIKESLSEMNPVKRLEILQNVMNTLVNEDIYGIPLYETQSTYSVSSSLDFEPRIDGYVLVKEIK